MNSGFITAKKSAPDQETRAPVMIRARPLYSCRKPNPLCAGPAGAPHHLRGSAQVERTARAPRWRPEEFVPNPLAIRMAKEIKGSEVQCCQIVPIFLRTRWSTHNDRGNLDRLPL